MASVLRPSIIRQWAATPTQRILSSAAPALRTGAQASHIARQRAAFQTSAKLAILPPLPQKIEGGVNDASPVPEPHPSHGSYHWSAERLVSMALVPVTIAPFAAGALNPLMDSTLIGLTLIHTYLGFQTIVTDYFPGWRVPFWRKFFEYANLAALGLSAWGFYQFETHDVGVTAAFARIWKGEPAKL